MFCPKCGSSLPDDAVFCFKCGSRIPTSQESNSVSQEIKNATNDSQRVPSSPNVGNTSNGQYMIHKGFYLSKTENTIVLIVGILALVNGAIMILPALSNISANWFSIILGLVFIGCGAGILNKQHSSLIMLDAIYLIALILAIIGAYGLISIGLFGLFAFLYILEILEIIVNMVLIHIAHKALNKKTQQNRSANANINQ